MHLPSNLEKPWLGQVLPAAIKATTGVGPQLPFEVPSARSAIVIMVDGLGLQLLSEYRGYARNLRSLLPEALELHTCLPSTTAAALTAFSTGALPGETNMVGYSVKHGRDVMNLLHFAPGVDGENWQPIPTFFSQLQGGEVEPVVVTTPKFAGSGLTKAAFRGARFVGRLTLAERFRTAKQLTQSRPSLVYLYWSEIDHAGHRHGPGSDEWLQELEEFDRELGVFLSAAPEDTVVLITGDHGMVEVEERIDIAQVPALREGVQVLAGEGRAVHVHAVPGQAGGVRDRWGDYFGERAKVFGPSEYAGVIGPGDGAKLIGDALVLAGERFVIVDSRQQSASMIGQRGVHGSFTEAEVLVPLLIASP